MRFHRVAALQCVILIVVPLFFGGCSNSSGPGDTSPYHSPSSPASVLANLEVAYNERDLDEYLACMSEDFRFYFTEVDQHDYPQLPPWFYRSDEEQVHENMFGDESGVESIHLRLMPAEVETIPGGATTGDAVRIRAETDLQIRFEDGMIWHATTPQDFYFREVSPTENARDGTMWETFGWEDREDWDSADRVEDAGWGGIKAMFLESLTHPSRRTSPVDVIEQLVTAYEEMNVDNYIDCLSEDFAFFPAEEDVNDPDNPVPSEWYLPDEIRIHDHMFGPDTNIESVWLTLTTSNVESDEGVPGDPSDDTWTYVENVDLWVYQTGGLPLLATTPSEFHLRVDPDEEGPYGETMWEIYEWYDIGTTESGRREMTSWGGIKALYW